ncbi:hypothetical protein L21SP4_01601 [Kiritimatiella glycovorans]|uniref:Type II secretion system protein G n=2 Tax=Kiritimatiella glycovorans TaxID=1307763 RepID=A0A0G3EL41_9BACT|nr:hypothetical protein L21SP4_01601 [Kiritimatiella glycovorans]
MVPRKMKEENRMSTKKTKKGQGGFTLIELLIVIGLMGALVALVLPKLTADREEAMGDVCDYNQAGTVRVLNQYADMFGKYPDGMHNGLDGTGSTASAIKGLPEAQHTNMIGQIDSTRYGLSTNEVASLNAAGIDTVAYGTGYQVTNLAAGVHVARCTTNWLDDTPAQYQFDGVTVADWETATGTPGWDTTNGTVVCLWITPTIDWSGGAGDNLDWTKGAVNYGISLEGQCPIPVSAASGEEVEFAYYMAYFKVYDEAPAVAARLIGTSCPECGVLNP